MKKKKKTIRSASEFVESLTIHFIVDRVEKIRDEIERTTTLYPVLKRNSNRKLKIPNQNKYLFRFQGRIKILFKTCEILNSFYTVVLNNMHRLNMYILII